MKELKSIKIKIIVVLLTFVIPDAHELLAQNDFAHPKYFEPVTHPIDIKLNYPANQSLNTPFITKKSLRLPLHNQAFFCKTEEEIHENSNIAFRFRLGSLNYVNWLESKSSTFLSDY